MDKIAALREALGEAEAFLLPVGDEFLGEYVPESAERLAWLTGFTGSAGLAVVTHDRAALFTDGRYTLQARAQAPSWEQYNSGETKPEEWLAENVRGPVAYDPWLHSMREVERTAKKGVKLIPLSPNPVDALWRDRPAVPSAPAFVHEAKYAGVAHGEKRVQAAAQLRKEGAVCAVLAAADSVNWLLNIRGRDVAFSPLFRAYAVLHDDARVALYADAARLPEEVREHLGVEVEIRPPAAFAEDLLALQGPVLLDPALTPDAVAHALLGREIMKADDPCQALKAVKNALELQGIRAAHLVDGLAVTRFLHWLDSNATDELGAMAKLLDFRAQDGSFFSPSFETIAGAGGNGAIVHYRSTSETNRRLKRGELFLLDSGGQYPSGTTDITRTVAVGEPPREARERFTLVLKGHIAVANARFPEGTSGSALDALARSALWREGLDYDHGTGHGVGCFLNVHEGPQRIGKRGGDAALKEGMIVSNEPGYYKEGHYGIRIENLVAVVRLGAMENGKAMLGFETLTCAPIDTRLVLPEMLDAGERAWLNAYHAWVLAVHSPALDDAGREWLAARCAAV